MNVITLFQHMPLAILLGVVFSILAPVLSSLIAHEHWDQSITGALTLLISTLTGFFTEWGAAGAGFSVKAALGASLLSWAVAIAAHSKIQSGSDFGAKLLAFGSPQPSAGQPDPTAAFELPTSGITGTSSEVAAINANPATTQAAGPESTVAPTT